MSKAAELLHITHSGLSKSMKTLQEELQCILLRPAGRGLALTQQGLQIYERAKEFLAHEERLFTIEKRTEPLSLRIGAVKIFLLCMGEQLNSNPFENTFLTLLNLEPGNMEQMIVNREIDFGISYVPFPMEQLEIIEIGKFSSSCYHLQGLFAELPFVEIPFVVPTQGLLSNSFGTKERDGWIESIYPRYKKYAVNLLSTALELTLQGLCAIYIPDFLAHKINHSRKSSEKLIKCAIPETLKNLQSAYVLRHKDQVNDPRFEHLCSLVKEMIHR